MNCVVSLFAYACVLCIIYLLQALLHLHVRLCIRDQVRSMDINAVNATSPRSDDVQPITILRAEFQIFSNESLLTAMGSLRHKS